MERPSAEISTLLNSLEHRPDVGNLGPLRPRDAAASRPYLDALTCQSDHYARTMDRTGTSSRLLIEPTIVPDLSHTGVKYVPAHQPAHNTPLFYPNGVKSINMANAIREHLHNALSGPPSPQPRGGSFIGMNSHTRTSISTPHTDLYHSRDRPPPRPIPAVVKARSPLDLRPTTASAGTSKRLDKMDHVDLIRTVRAQSARLQTAIRARPPDGRKDRPAQQKAREGTIGGAIRRQERL